MTRHAAKLLAKAIHLDDIPQFRSLLFDESWPHDLEPLDYERLMHKALKLGRKRIVGMLLKKNHLASNSCQGIYDALLHMALKKYGRSSGWCDVIERLVDGFGARVEARDEQGNTAVHLGFLHDAGNRLMQFLLRRFAGRENIVNGEGLSVLHIACTRNNLDVVERLCSANNVDVNCQVSLHSESIYAGYSPLHFAVEYRRLNIASYLLNEGASVNVQDANGSTPLHCACYRRDVEMLDLLHSFDQSNVNIVDNFGLTHFMAACAATDVLLAKKYLLIAEIRSNTPPAVLMNSRAKDLDTFPYGGYTPVHFAADFGRSKTVKLLLKYNVDCCVAATDDLTPLDLARERGHDEICLDLKQSCKRIVTRETVEPELDVNFNEVLSFSSKCQSNSRGDSSLNDSGGTDSFYSCTSNSP